MSNALGTQIGGTHYKVLPYQPIELIGELRMDYFQGCIIKYISRNKNNKIEDLQKAIHYCELAKELGVGIKYIDFKHSQSLKYEIGKYVKMNNLPEICSSIIFQVLQNQYNIAIGLINSLININKEKMKNKHKCNILWDTERIRIFVENSFSLGIIYEYHTISIGLFFLKIDFYLRK